MPFARAAVLLAGALAALGAWAAPVAFVADIRGNATIEGDGKLAFLAELAPGTRLVLGTNASAAITYVGSGAEFAITGPGLFLVSADEVTAERGAKPKRRTVTALTNTGVVARAAQTATASLRMRGLGSAPSAAALQFPVATRIATLQPAMRWRSGPGEAYTVTLHDAAGELWKGRGAADGTRPSVPLAAATRYSWAVTGARAFPARVVHALLLQEMGADQEAREAWAELARERPEMPELPALAR